MPDPTVLSGSRNTQNILQARRVIDMADGILLLSPNDSPFTVLSAKMAKKSVFNPKFEWLEDDLLPKWSTVNLSAGYSSSATEIIVLNGNYFDFGTGLVTLVKVPRTGEVMKVTSISSNTLTVTRGIGSTIGAALVNGDPLLILGTVSQEGVGSPNARTTLETALFNYTQILKKAVEATNTEEASKLYGGSDRNYQRKKMGIEHIIDIERTLWFGEKSIDTSGTHPIRTTGGVLEFLTDNVVDVGGMLTEVEFDAFCRDLFKYGSNQKYLFCSPLVLSVINGWAMGRVQMTSKETTYGINIQKYASTHGELNLVQNRLFEGDIYGGYAVALDFSDGAIEYKYLLGRDTKLETDIQANDADGWKDQYVTEFGLKMAGVKKHAIMKNITS